MLKFKAPKVRYIYGTNPDFDWPFFHKPAYYSPDIKVYRYIEIHSTMKYFVQGTLILLMFVQAACRKQEEPTPASVDYRQEMRNLVMEISDYARETKKGFIVIPQNGQELITYSGEADGKLALDYLNAIDGTGREDLFFGYDQDNKPTPAPETAYMLSFCKQLTQAGKTVLVTDYCSSHENMDLSYDTNHTFEFISFAAPDRELRVIPEYPPVIYGNNANNIDRLADARNFLYLINTEYFQDKAAFIASVQNTDYDLIIMDLFFNDSAFTSEEIAQLKQKKNGGKRMVVCYMSIGEAEAYRYYWQNDWKPGNPGWIADENPDWKGNYKVKYWDREWKNLIYGNENAYLDKVITAGFDGVYLDIIDAFEYFEN